MVFHLERGEVEHDLLSGRDLDLPDALSTVAVVVGPARRVQHALRCKVIATTNFGKVMQVETSCSFNQFAFQSLFYMSLHLAARMWR